MRNQMGGVVILTAFLVMWGGAGQAATYKIDPEHTTVGFKVRHLFTQVQGRFDQFDGTIEFDPGNPKAAQVKGTINAGSVNTNVAERDKDLRSARFFDVEKHPNINFQSLEVVELNGDGTHGKMKGSLTIHGITRPVVLDVSYLGAGKDPWGNQRAGFSAATTINRKDFGLTWNEVLEAGGVLVGDEVQIEIHAEGMLVE